MSVHTARARKCAAARAQRANPAAREQSRPMGRVESPALRLPRAKAVMRRYMLPPGGAHTSGNSEINRHHAIRAGKGRNCGWGIFTTPKPTAEPCWPGCRGLRHLLFFVHASTDMYDESCARRLYEARIHGRGLPAWYGGVALKAPQKRRGGSACECRPEKVSLRRVHWGHVGPTAWRGHHGSPHA